MGEQTITPTDALREYVLPSQAPGHAEEGTSQPPRPRVIGPGRFERGYLQRLSGLETELEIARERERRQAESLREGLEAKRALELSQRVEHGCQRRIDRLEGRLEERTQALLESERQHKRLVLALGAMQRENELLRAQLPLQLAGSSQRGLSSASGDRSSAARPRTGLWRWIFRSRR